MTIMTHNQMFGEQDQDDEPFDQTEEEKQTWEEAERAFSRAGKPDEREEAETTSA